MLKKRILYVLIILLVLATAGVYVYSKIKQEKPVLSLIPQDYERLIVLHTTSLLEDGLGTIITDDNSLRDIVKYVPACLAKADWSKLGINPFGDIAFYSVHKPQHAYEVFVIPVFSEKKAKTFAVEELHDTLSFKELKSNLFYFSNNSIAFAVDNGYAYIIRFTSEVEVSETLLDAIINVNPNTSLINDSLVLANNKLDCYGYAVSKKQPHILTYDFIDSSTPLIVKWERNSDTLCVSYIQAVHKNIQIQEPKSFKVPVFNSRYFSITYAGDVYTEFAQIKPGLLSNFQIKANNLSIDSAFLFNNLAPGISFAYFGKDSIVNKHISYEFDDNFNKVEIVSESTEFIVDFALQLNFKSEAIKDSIITLFTKEGLIVHKNNRQQIIGINPQQAMFLQHSEAKMLITGTSKRIDNILSKKKTQVQYSYLDLKLVPNNNLLNRVSETFNIDKPLSAFISEIRIKSHVNNNTLESVLTFVPKESMSVFEILSSFNKLLVNED